MVLNLLALPLAVAAVYLQGSDTSIAVSPGARLEFSRYRGDISIGTWDRNEVRVAGAGGAREGWDIRVSGSTVVIGSGSGRGSRSPRGYSVTVPAWMDLRLVGMSGDVTVEGSEGRIEVETFQGDIVVTGGRDVSLRTASGDIRLAGARGRVVLATVSGDVEVSGAEGTIEAQAVSGDIRLRGIRSEDVVATTVSGDIEYSGSLVRGGRYRFSAHSGDITVRVPAGAGLVVDVSTFSGGFESEYPVALAPGGGRGRRFTFTLGDGGARLELESFSGDIRLIKP